MEYPVFTVHCKKEKNKSKYVLYSDYNISFVERIKNIDGNERKWNPDDKVWEFTVMGLYLLIKSYKNSDKIYFNFGDDENKNQFLKLVKKEKDKEKKRREEFELLEKNKLEWNQFKFDLERNYENKSKELHSYLKPNTTLFPHQIVATLFANKVNNVLISHEMGLGKTLVSISFVEMNKLNKVVVITPNSLKFNYYNEVEKFTNSKAHIVNWNKNKYTIEESKYIILNYEFFNSSDKKVADNKWKSLGIKKIDALVSDECQRLKNSKSNTYKNFKRIFKNSIFNNTPKKIFLSGTPAPNRAYELYNVLNQISPLEFKRKVDFYQYYCGMTYDYFGGWGYITNTEEQKFEELYEKISPYTHRKRKSEVLKNLPDKTYQRVNLELTSSQKKKYDDIEKNTANELNDEEKNHHLSILVDLRKYLSEIKGESIKDIVYDIINTGEKVVIIDFFKNTLKELHKEFESISVLHTGDQTIEEREEAINKFQNPISDIKIFLGSMEVTKEGLTLTASSKMFLLTLPFVPGVYDQITDRLHRIGQKNAVNIYIPVFEDTIDILTLDLIDNKKTELSIVMDNEEYINNMKTDVLKNVFKNLRKKYEKQ